MNDRPLYDVVPEWSGERKEAFVMYRDMGADRNLRGVAQVLRKSDTLIARWSSEDQWRIRVAAWDAEQDRIRQAAHKQELEKVTRRHARALESSIVALMQPAVELARRIEEEGDEFTKDLSPVELANLTHAAAKVLPTLVTASRLVHGVSTQNVAVKGEHRVKVESMSQDELDAQLHGTDDGAAALLEEPPTIDGSARELLPGDVDPAA